MLWYTGTNKPRLQCHDCTDKSCQLLLHKDLSGKCQTKPGGKCFIRQDPNGCKCTRTGNRNSYKQRHWNNCVWRLCLVTYVPRPTIVFHVLCSVTYRGCADQAHYPKLDYDYVGCKYQRYMAWDHKAVLWCFCDFDACNVNATFVGNHYSGQRAGSNCWCYHLSYSCQYVCVFALAAGVVFSRGV